MATVAKWFASLIPALWLGLTGMGAIASTNQALVVVNCVHLDALDFSQGGSADFAYFRIERDADIGFAPGKKAHDQGLFLVGEISKQPIACDVNGKKVVLRVPSYSANQSGCSEENYQIELWIDDEIHLRTAPRSKGEDCDYWSRNPFQGTFEVDANGYVMSCTDEITGQGSPAAPHMISESNIEAVRKYEDELRKAKWRIEHTMEPFGTDANTFHERECG